ncbi:unnamed protein product [Phytophthora lilii]|uniref:Unnamed protein product n=1 Tax=Phytophthora lilii TaxID=2077276 RepID=A0A9W6THS1_9STRA|nr:unnamed protein product [Phytophthora lilii]
MIAGSRNSRQNCLKKVLSSLTSGSNITPGFVPAILKTSFAKWLGRTDIPAGSIDIEFRPTGKCGEDNPPAGICFARDGDGGSSPAIRKNMVSRGSVEALGTVTVDGGAAAKF